MIASGGAPRALAAVTCSRARCTIVSARTMRARPGQDIRPSTREIPSSEGAKSVATRSATRKRGRIITKSVERISASSRRPPRFGVVAVDALARDARLPGAVTTMEIGIGGIHLVQELMRGYDVLLFDVVDCGGWPGELFLLEPDCPRSRR